jgi:transposase
VAERLLSDDLWTAVAPVLPGKEGDPGCRARDNRLFLEAVFWIARTGAPWRDLPPEFGKWYTAYTRYHRWSKKRVWPRVFEVLEKQGALEVIQFATNLRWIEEAAPLPSENPTSHKAAA